MKAPGPANSFWDRRLQPQPVVGNPAKYRELIQASRLATSLPPDLVEKHLAADSGEIPPPSHRQYYYDDRHHDYWLSGLHDYLLVMSEWRRFRSHQPISAYFDFGGSSGRVARHFANMHRDARVYVSDLHVSAVEWATNHLPHNVFAFQSRLEPVLPIPDKSVDLITAFSVFTHIDTHERGWLAELRRVMKNKGLLYVTVGTEEVWQNLMEVDWRYEKFAAKSSEFAAIPRGTPMRDERLSFPRMEDSYATVFHKKEYIRRTWSEFFDIKDIIKPKDRVSQSVVVMEPKK